MPDRLVLVHPWTVDQTAWIEEHGLDPASTLQAEIGPDTMINGETFVRFEVLTPLLSDAPTGGE